MVAFERVRNVAVCLAIATTLTRGKPGMARDVSSCTFVWKVNATLLCQSRGVLYHTELLPPIMIRLSSGRKLASKAGLGGAAAAVVSVEIKCVH